MMSGQLAECRRRGTPSGVPLRISIRSVNGRFLLFGVEGVEDFVGDDEVPSLIFSDVAGAHEQCDR